MSARRSKVINVYIEPTLHAAVETAATAKDQSISDFVRSAIVKELADMGLMTDGVAIAIMAR